MSDSRHRGRVDQRRFGAGLHALRVRRRLSQHELEQRCGISRSKISRIERGAVARVPFGDIVALADALDARVELDLRWRGAALDRLVDARHASLVASIVGWLTAAGWTCLTEVSFSIFGERGSIDVLALHPSGALLIIEAKASIGDANQTLIALDRKIRLAPSIARERGLSRGPVGGLLVIESTTTNRRRIRANDLVFRASLPTRSSDCRAWVRRPTGPPPRGIVFIAVPDSQSMRRV